ncbi:MAG: tetratricopeptide repeat protein [Planctomycetota bacterium]|jgi:tetratricopeptide (TPR) repeat protein
MAVVVGLVTVLIVGFAARAQDSTPGARGDQEARKARLAERDRFSKQARALQKAGKIEEAVQVLQAVLAIEREVFGDVHEEVAGTLSWIAGLEKSRGGFAAARAAQKRVLAIRTQLLGAGHWKVTDARLELEDLRRWESLSAAQQARLREAVELTRAVVRLWRKGAYREAVPKAERALAIRREILGEEHPDYASRLNNLAALYKSMGEYAQAEPLLRQAREIWKKALGEEHPDYARSLHNLAWLYVSMGEYAQAEPLCRQAREIFKKALGEEHPDYATSLNNLALLYDSMGEYAKAEPLYRQALEIDKKALGEEHPDYATSLHNLASLYVSMGEYAKAEPLYLQALDLRRELGQKDKVAETLVSLGRAELKHGDHKSAVAHLDEALTLAREANAPGTILMATVYRARLSGGDVEAALAALEEHEERVWHTGKMEARFRLWELTKDKTHLAEAKRLLDFAVEHSPEDCRTSMIENVPLHRDIMKAWEEQGGD